MAHPIGEEPFETYLVKRGYSWLYEPLMGSSRPDYRLTGGCPDCVIEVEGLDVPKARPVSGYYPTTAVREAMRRGRNQLHACKTIPAAIALYSEAFYRMITPVTVASAAFGPGYQDCSLPVSAGKRPIPSLKFSNRKDLPADLHHLADPFLSPAANRRVSAVIAVVRYPEGSTEPVGLAVIENRHARIPFPGDLFKGPLDQRWAWLGEACTRVWIGDEANGFYQRGYPFDLI